MGFSPSQLKVSFEHILVPMTNCYELLLVPVGFFQSVVKCLLTWADLEGHVTLFREVFDFGNLYSLPVLRIFCTDISVSVSFCPTIHSDFGNLVYVVEEGGLCQNTRVELPVSWPLLGGTMQLEAQDCTVMVRVGKMIDCSL